MLWPPMSTSAWLPAARKEDALTPAPGMKHELVCEEQRKDRQHEPVDNKYGPEDETEERANSS